METKIIYQVLKNLNGIQEIEYIKLDERYFYNTSNLKNKLEDKYSKCFLDKSEAVEYQKKLIQEQINYHKKYMEFYQEMLNK